MESIAIRGYHHSDSGEMVRLHNSSEEFFEEAQVTPEFIQCISERDDYRFFVAEKDGKVIGYCGTLFYTNHGRAEIGPILVSPGYRQQDVGSMLLNKTIQFLREQGMHRVIARVKSLNSDAQKFFLNAGFEEEGRFRGYTKKREDVCQFVKFIGPDL